jgi:hypothetical protein
MNIPLRLFRIWIEVLFILLLIDLHLLSGQEREYLAIIPPFHDKPGVMGIEGPVRLKSQRFVLFLLNNAVAVFSEADFVNTGTEPVFQEFTLPSTGHDENSLMPGGKISTGILSVQLWVQGEKIVPEFINTGNEDWFTLRARFESWEQKKLKALFWAQTSLTDVDLLPGVDTTIIPEGARGFMFDLSHAGIWNGSIETISMTLVPLQRIDIHHGSFHVNPPTYEMQDSVLTWKLYNVEPSISDNIYIWYSSGEKEDQEYNTMAKLSAYIVKTVYDDLLRYVRKVDEE